MPDRYGDADDEPPIVDLDSRRNAREAAAAVERARRQRERLAETRAVHAPLSNAHAAAARTQREATTARAEAHRNALRIANCTLCDDDGYRGHRVCDHIDRSATAARGSALVREAMNKNRQQ